MTLSHKLRAAAGNASGGGIVTTGLAQYWDFGDLNCYNTGVSATAITDLSGAGNHGYFLSSTQPTYYSANGGYIQNTGSNQFAQKGISASSSAPSAQSFLRNIGTGNFTIEFWVDIWGSSGNFLYSDGSQEVSFSPYFQFNFYSQNIIVSNQTMSGTGFTGTTNAYNVNITNGTSGASPPSVALDNPYSYPTTNLHHGWQHLVFTRTSTGTNGFKVYKNNTLVSTHTNPINYYMPQLPSGYITDVTQYFDHLNSRFAIFRFYTTHGFTASDVARNYNAEKARFGL